MYEFDWVYSFLPYLLTRRAGDHAKSPSQQSSLVFCGAFSMLAVCAVNFTPVASCFAKSSSIPSYMVLLIFRAGFSAKAYTGIIPKMTSIYFGDGGVFGV